MTVRKYINRPTTTDINNLLFEKVKVTLYDETVLKGYLRKIGDKYIGFSSNLKVLKNYFFITKTKTGNEILADSVFKPGHVKEIEWDSI